MQSNELRVGALWMRERERLGKRDPKFPKSGEPRHAHVPLVKIT